MRVRWLRAALNNLDAESDYIGQDNPAAAEELICTIVEATERLKRYPALGRPGRVTGTRELVVPGTPYIVPYRIRTGIVEIIRVFHAARK